MLYFAMLCDWPAHQNLTLDDGQDSTEPLPETAQHMAQVSTNDDDVHNRHTTIAFISHRFTSST